MIRGAEGEFTWEKKDGDGYVCVALNRHQYNGKHWNSFLNVIFQELSEQLENKYDKKVISLDDYGENLIILHPISSVDVTEDGFKYFIQEQKYCWTVMRDTDGVDQLDRVLFAIDKIKSLVNTELSN